MSRIIPDKQDNYFVIAFPVIALVFAAFFLYATPPSQGTDEPNHLYRSYQISTGTLTPQTDIPRRGGEVPASLLDMCLKFTRLRFDPPHVTSQDSIRQYARVALNPGDTRFVDHPNTAVYPWLVYAPAAVGLAIGRNTGFSALGTFYWARWMGLLVWITAGTFALWLLPAWRGLFAAVLLLPMSVWTHSIVSADTMTDSVAVVVIAYILRLAFGRKQVSNRRIGWLAVGAILLATMKLVYSPILLLAAIIPREKFTSLGGKWVAASFVGGLTLLTVLFWSYKSSQIYLPYDDYAVDYREGLDLPYYSHVGKQRDLIIEKPTRLFRAVGNSLVDAAHMYVDAFIGALGWLEIELPSWAIVFGYLSLLYAALTSRWITTTVRLNLFLCIALCYILVIFSQLLSWEPVGSPTVGTVQGRYLTPFAPLIVLIFAAGYSKYRMNWLILLNSSLLICVSIYELLQRYYFHGLPWNGPPAG